ncbi:MAG: hypothetical protein QF506_00190 [Candidatus Woesearchaeota archaeon]|jgi:hypothetical protein|nr:hypothetical protein [Candidatus Woesearchaeota archaeon]
MKNKNIMFGMLVLIALAQLTLVSALSIDISMKESFGVGEEIYFDYTITSDVSQEIEYLASVSCPNAPLALLDVKTVSLEANVALTEKHVYMSSVDESIEPQMCDATVGILSPEISEEKSFEIKVNPSFEFNVLICKDLNCAEKTKVFTLNKDIYLDYISEIPSPIITATLTSPDKSTKQLTIPSSIKAEQTGTYTLEVKASKQDYKTITKKIQFGVIEQEADIPYTRIQDIKVIPPEKPKEIPQKSRLYTITSFLIVVLVIILIVYQLYRKKQKDLERELELKTYITNSLARGFTKQQLKQGLLKEGWNKRLVDKAFNNLMEPRKLSKLESLELQNYINNALRRGYKKQQIKQELLNEGWHERQIDEALKNNRML